MRNTRFFNLYANILLFLYIHEDEIELALFTNNLISTFN